MAPPLLTDDLLGACSLQLVANLVSLDDIRQAQARIRGIAVRTPLLRYSAADGELYLKAECFQPIGSFKLRGAYNKMVRLSPARLAAGVITASAGNHAQGVALSARKLGCHARVVMPITTPASVITRSFLIRHASSSCPGLTRASTKASAA